MVNNQEAILKKIRSRRQTIIKNGTYTLDSVTRISSGDSTIADDTDIPHKAVDSFQSNEDNLLSEYSDTNQNSLSEYGVYDSQDALVSEIMNKFSSNIQNNVNDLFENIG